MLSKNRLVYLLVKRSNYDDRLDYALQGARTDAEVYVYYVARWVNTHHMERLDAQLDTLLLNEKKVVVSTTI